VHPAVHDRPRAEIARRTLSYRNRFSCELQFSANTLQRIARADAKFRTAAWIERIGVARSSRVLAKPSRVRELFSLNIASTKVCSATLSIGLSADSCCLWHDESPSSATPVIRATATTLKVGFHIRRNYSLITPRCSQPYMRKTKESRETARANVAFNALSKRSARQIAERARA
jgi:hypothetical protein